MNSSGPRGRAFVSAGSDAGDRRASLKKAVAELGRAAGTHVKNVSSLYLSKPVGTGGERWFLNCVMEVETESGPLELLDMLEKIEASLGREGKGRNEPRTIDLDLVLYGNLSLDAPRLTLPHPRMSARRFVLEPLLEIAPDAEHPVLGKMSALLPAVMGQEVVRAEPFVPAAAPRRMAVEGPIGSGKTSLVEKLSDYYGARPVYEMSVENPFLASFYEEPRRFAFAVQLFFLLSRLGLSLEAEREGATATVSDFHHDKDLLFASLTLEAGELELYNEIRRHAGPRPAAPDLTIFLSAKEKTLFQRTKKRARGCEACITEKYVAEVARAYREWGARFEGPALMVDADEVDFARDEAAFGRLLWSISRPVGGRGPSGASDG